MEDYKERKDNSNIQSLMKYCMMDEQLATEFYNNFVKDFMYYHHPEDWEALVYIMLTRNYMLMNEETKQQYLNNKEILLKEFPGFLSKSSAAKYLFWNHYDIDKARENIKEDIVKIL